MGWDRGWDVAEVFQDDVVSRYGAPFSSGHVGITKKHQSHRKICILHHKRTRAILKRPSIWGERCMAVEQTPAFIIPPRPDLSVGPSFDHPPENSPAWFINENEGRRHATHASILPPPATSSPAVPKSRTKQGAEDSIVNPPCVCLDRGGRASIVERFRLSHGCW